MVSAGVQSWFYKTELNNYREKHHGNFGRWNGTPDFHIEGAKSFRQRLTLQESPSRSVPLLESEKDEIKKLEKYEIPGLDSSIWKFSKMLGIGGNGAVGLWVKTDANQEDAEYYDKDNLIKVVMKISLSNMALNEEHQIVSSLTRRGPHVVRLVHDVYGTLEKAKERGMVKRMYMECCSGGDLHGLIWRRKRANMPLFEKTLWMFFECLVKGLSIMEFGDEKLGPARIHECGCLIHFDLKPMNVLLAEANQHDHAGKLPILKIGDFGLSLWNEYFDDVDRATKAVQRYYGTPGYFTPEQFSERWEVQPDADDSKWEVCGNYGPWTNIWQVGAIMYQLLTLGEPPEPIGFQHPSGKFENVIGTTYGADLKDQKHAYSVALKELIWRCLAEKPKNRPTLAQLQKEIDRAKLAFKSEAAVQQLADVIENILISPTEDAVIPPPFILQGPRHVLPGGEKRGRTNFSEGNSSRPRKRPRQISRTQSRQPLNSTVLNICVYYKPKGNIFHHYHTFKVNPSTLITELSTMILAESGWWLEPGFTLRMMADDPGGGADFESTENMWDCGIREGSKLRLKLGPKLDGRGRNAR